MEDRYYPNWKLIWFLIVPVWAIVVFSIWAISRPVIDAVLNDGIILTSRDSLSIALLDAVFIVAGIMASWGPISGFLTQITETTITKDYYAPPPPFGIFAQHGFSR